MSSSSDPTGEMSPGQRLLETARRLFCREGIHATGVARILTEAGVARRTLYENYGSKDNLLKAAFEHEAQMWFQWLDDLPRRASDPEQQLLILFDVLQEWFSSDRFFGCLFTNAVAEHEKESSWVRDLALAHFSEVQRRIVVLAGAAGLVDPQAFARQFCLLVDGAIAIAMVTRKSDSADTARTIAHCLLEHAARA
ncbi:TetR/AcrR family transcriptional regulator [Pandoraea oxalativorans]|uniref:TetR family transcriptional regulator n=1 Tax=Pandoraea oxalativorans TaxID=573737 RepID=A0A0E3YDI2_9BURK|nr:TetR/AcrR family transcriptional regulator [Pandoraea oxalativorans]AKC69937.1 TetR family transcriptional regulator [Pandoraea oxalativorans]